MAFMILMTPNDKTAACTSTVPQFRRRKWECSARKSRLSCVLRARGRRVLEDARTEKRRSDPLRSQRRNCCKLTSRDRRADLRNVGNVIVAARSNQCDRAGVLAPRGIRVNACMQCR